MFKIKFFKTLLIISISLVFVSFNFVSADVKQGVELKDPLGMGDEKDAPQIFIGRIIDASLGVVGSLALLMFVYGGFTWMLAAGNSERVEKGKRILFWATVGLMVIFTSYIIVHFVIFELVGAPGGG